MKTTWIVGDVETTGFSKPAGVCDIAWTEVDDDLNEIESVSSLIDPERSIEPGASGVHHITDDMVADAPTMSEFFEFVLERPNIAGDVVLLAHNVSYDEPFFRPWCENLVGTIDSLRLARRYYPEAPDHKLATLSYYLNLSKGTAHRAAGDVETLLSLLRHMRDNHGFTLADSFRRRDEPVMVPSMPFGKHKGKTFFELPLDYLQWMLKKGDFGPDINYTVKRVLKEAHGVEA